MESAIIKEKRLKKWERAWKIRLIEERNPNYETLVIPKNGDSPPSQSGRFVAGARRIGLVRADVAAETDFCRICKRHSALQEGDRCVPERNIVGAV